MPRSMSLSHPLLHRARTVARDSGTTRYIVEMDDGESRSQTVCSERYLASDDFAAFDGQVLAEVSPDGSVTY